MKLHAVTYNQISVGSPIEIIGYKIINTEDEVFTRMLIDDGYFHSFDDDNKEYFLIYINIYNTKSTIPYFLNFKKMLLNIMRDEIIDKLME